MTLGRIRGARRVDDQHNVIAGDAAGPDIVVGKEADRSLLLDVVERTLRRVPGGEVDEGGEGAIDSSLLQPLRGHYQIETRHLRTGGKPSGSFHWDPGEVVRLPVVDGAGDEHPAHAVVLWIGDA